MQLVGHLNSNTDKSIITYIYIKVIVIVYKGRGIAIVICSSLMQ